MIKKHERHTAAFLLLFLSQESSYGAALLAKMDSELPYCFSDSASVYRCLKKMEEYGHVNTRWQTTQNGAPMKWYTITTQGLKALKEQADDIKKRHDNLEFFLKKYQENK